jgi:transposase
MARENKETKRLSREQIIDLYKVGPEAVFSLVEHFQDSIQQLSVRVQKLELQENKDSHNSNKPPSTDGFGKKPPKQRMRSGKNPVDK